jgi:hypothetical protein
MSIVECCVFDSITCIIGCIVVYFINDIKAYDKIQLIPSEDNDDNDNSEDEDKLNNTDNILTFENIKLLHPINEQPQAFIILQK